MLNFNSVRKLFPKVKIKTKEAPKQSFITKESMKRRALILPIVKTKAKYVSEIAIELDSNAEQTRYDVRNMITAGQLVNLAQGKGKYFVKAA